MSRVANAPIAIPSGVEVNVSDSLMVVKGKLGELSFNLRNDVQVEIENNLIKIGWDQSSKEAKSQAGTARASINNMVIGLS